jgi:hypothetical protein
VKGSESHQRIITYTFGGLKFAIRFESDGYHRDLATACQPIPSKFPGMRGPDVEMDLLSVMKTTSLTSSKQKTASSGDGLQIKLGGQRIPQKAIFDLKTRSARGEIDMAEIYPRLWVSQIPNFVIGYHTRGTFEDIRKHDVGDDLNNWQKENQAALGRLNILIQKIISHAKGKGNGKLEVCRNDLDVLEIREQAGGGCDALPADVKSRWTGEKDLVEPRSPGAQEKHKIEAEEAQLNQLNPNEVSEPDFHRYSAEHAELDPWYSDEASEPDFTACSAEDCGYCGHCTY